LVCWHNVEDLKSDTFLTEGIASRLRGDTKRIGVPMDRRRAALPLALRCSTTSITLGMNLPGVIIRKVQCACLYRPTARRIRSQQSEKGVREDFSLRRE